MNDCRFKLRGAFALSMDSRPYLRVRCSFDPTFSGSKIRGLSDPDSLDNDSVAYDLTEAQVDACPFLAAAMRSGCREAEQGEVFLHDPLPVVERIVGFLRTGNTYIHEAILWPLAHLGGVAVVADRLGLADLSNAANKTLRWWQENGTVQQFDSMNLPTGSPIFDDFWTRALERRFSRDYIQSLRDDLFPKKKVVEILAEIERGDWRRIVELASLRVSKRLLRETDLAKRLNIAAGRTLKNPRASVRRMTAAREGSTLVQTWREQFRSGTLPSGDTHPAELYRHHRRQLLCRQPRRRTILLDNLSK